MRSLGHLDRSHSRPHGWTGTGTFSRMDWDGHSNEAHERNRLRASTGIGLVPRVTSSER